LRELFAPAAALPASLVMPVLGEELPVVVPVVGDPVVVPPGEGLTEPVELVPPVEPVPVCALANGPANVSTATNPRVPSFELPIFMIVVPFQLPTRETVASGYVSSVGINWV
jgi:hypothetical protein